MSHRRTPTGPWIPSSRLGAFGLNRQPAVAHDDVYILGRIDPRKFCTHDVVAIFHLVLKADHMAFEHRVQAHPRREVGEQFGDRWQKRPTRPLRREIGRGVVAVDVVRGAGKEVALDPVVAVEAR
jgi:hypothetical protein